MSTGDQYRSVKRDESGDCEMRTCQSCGGVIGRDCFNPIECMMITQAMIADEAVQKALRRDEESERRHHDDTANTGGE